MKKIIWFALSMVVSACGQEPAKEAPKYKYDLSKAGCPVGEQRFSTLPEYCSALKDDVLNQNCAWTERRGMYERDCGTDWAFYNGN